MTMSAAEYLASKGWNVGDVLRGEPIFENGKQIECARYVRLTAVGEQMILGRTMLVGETHWRSESSLSFDCREWSRMGTFSGGIS